MKIAIYAGSFDPITKGHIDVVERASKIFDKVILLIAVNSKKQTLFDMSERVEMAKASLAHCENALVDHFEGLTVDYAKKVGAIALIRGVRSMTDFEFEFQIALMNRKMNPDLQTVFLMPHEKYTYLNSSIIRELSRFRVDVSEFVSQPVVEKLQEKFRNQ